MRIISGKLKGRRFEMPKEAHKTRPTTDISRESLFNILENKIDLDDIVVLDLFAGSGGIGYEFISRGASKVYFVEKFHTCSFFIEKTLKELNIEAFGTVKKTDVFQFIKQSEKNYFDVIFADPPYDLKTLSKIPSIIIENNILKKDSLLIIEHDERNNFEKHPNFVESRKYGQSQFSFFKA
jgi:16S rRNA (guanine(966)-N(2))-methyltransferase RsmD